MADAPKARFANQWSLADLGLPPDYEALQPDEQKAARLVVAHSWYDKENHPDDFCTDEEQFVRWVRLFVEHYLKPAECNKGRYTLPGPLNKYDMVRALAKKPLMDTEPTKVILSATRGFSKTITIFHEATMAAVLGCPGLKVLLSEATRDRTREEMREFRRQIEENEIIHADFGGAGELFPKSKFATEPWNQDNLTFCTGSVVAGRSCLSAIRGLHPDLIIVDDPEKDKKKSRNAQWRREFFDWYFFVWLQMLRRGKVSIWIGTPNNELSCLKLALKGRSEGSDQRDERFDDHHRVYIRVVEKGPDGKEFSCYPELISLKAYRNKLKTMGREGRSAEIDTDPIAGGDIVWAINEFRHGWMKCVQYEGTPQQRFYMLDLKTGETQPWLEWKRSLAISGANDIADSLDPNSDPAVTVIIGVDSRGVIYLLDVWYRICLTDLHTPKAFELANEWACTHMGWEVAALQRIVLRGAEKEADKCRRKGWNVPIVVPVPNHCQSDKKMSRIRGSLMPLISDESIRFMRFEKTKTADGKVHRPAACPHKQYHIDMATALETMTDEGTGGYIDLPDALEMAIRVAGQRKGMMMSGSANTSTEQLAAWNRVGVEFDPRLLPESMWTPEMRAMMADGLNPDANGHRNFLYEDDPYATYG